MRPLHTGCGKRILISTAELVPRSTVFAKGTHRTTRLVGIFEAIQHHVVEYAVVPDTHTTACFGQKVGGVTHTFHTPCHQHIVAVSKQHVMRQHGGFHARAAHLGQRDRPGALR